MKRLILAATLAIAVPAFAQNTAAPASDAGTSATTPTDTTATPPADTAAPAADTAAPAATTSATPATTAAAPAAADTSSYPPCTAKVTDRCVEKASSPRPHARKKKK
jgi:hypothetical protein